MSFISSSYLVMFVLIVIISLEVVIIDRISELFRHQRFRVAVQFGIGNVVPMPVTFKLLEPKLVSRDAVWQPVYGTRNKFFVYSAFLDRRWPPLIRVIAVTSRWGAAGVMCRVWLRNSSSYMFRGKVQLLNENKNLNYSGYYVLCVLREAGLRPPDLVGAVVAVVSDQHTTHVHTNLLPVIDTQSQQGNKDIEYDVDIMTMESLQDDSKTSVCVCVKPLIRQYERADWLVEWLEMNVLLGVTHFYMYNHSVSRSVSCVLRHYQQRGLLTLLPWGLDINPDEIWYQGQSASFNDCLYRSMSSTEWLLELDLDELILPRRANNLTSLLNKARISSRSPRKKPAVLIFRNTFFYLMWEDDPEVRYSLITSRKTRRCADPHPMFKRSKFAVRPTEAIELGNHFTWRLIHGSFTACVAPKRALVHHYRVSCESASNSCVHIRSVVDRTAHRWTRILQHRITSILPLIRDTCRTLGE